MKQKRTYSLTAKERKAKRMAEENKSARKSNAKANDVKPTVETRESAEKAMAQSQKRSRLTAIIIGGAACLAVLLIVIALIVPAIMYAVNPYRGYDKVIARFDLSNDMVLEYIIDEDEYDTAATNFIFLAENKFFDNTVFYDAQNGWLRFGGYEAQPQSNASSDFSRTHHRGDSLSYCESFSALANSKFDRATYKFGYRLRADSGGTETRVVEQLGALTFRYSDTATEFQFNYGISNNETVSGDLTNIPCTMVGRALNDETIANLKTVAATGAANNSLTSGYKWRPPTPDILIRSVKVYNLDSSKWKNFDFISYMSDNDKSGSRRYTSWIVRV